MPWLRTICCLLALALNAFAPVPVPPRPIAKLAPVPVVGPSPITSDCRYLFVVDTSAAMQRSAEGLYRATHRLIATGVGNRMQEGDIFTVWTYADTVLTREFPLNAWTRDLDIALANRTYEFLAQQKFRGKSNLRPVFAELGQALAIATNLTVILVSDGTDVVVGTPFDRAINILYGKRGSELRAAKMPFLTALVTDHGEFTHWAVRGGLEDIALPFPVPPLLPAPVPVPALAVATPPPTPIPVVFTPPPPQPTVTTNPAPPPVAPPPAKPVTTAVASVTPAPKPAEPVPPPAPKKPEVPPPLTVPPTKPIVTLVPVTPPPAPVIIPARYQPQSVTDASNALAKVELLRPSTATNVPPGQPLAARVIVPPPAPPKLTNAPLTPPLPVPVAKPITNPVPPAPVAVPRVVPALPLPAAKLPEPKVVAATTNPPARLTNAGPPAVIPPPKAEARAEPKPPVAAPAPTVAVPKPAATAAKPPAPPASTNVSPTPKRAAAPPVPLAVASGPARRAGWLYLAAALGLLAVAGGIIAHLLRPPAQPSVISRSLDDQRG